MWWNINFFFLTNLVYSEETVRWSYLRIGQHDVLDEGQAPWLAIFHTYIVNLVATDLTVLLAWRQGAPHHFKRCGVQDLYLHPPWRSPRNCGWRNKKLESENQVPIHYFQTFVGMWKCSSFNKCNKHTVLYRTEIAPNPSHYLWKQCRVREAHQTVMADDNSE